jgi:protein TonB
VRNARAGVLSVQEGGRENGFLLAADQLRTGAMFYPRAGAGGSIHLRLEVADSAARRIAQELTATFSPIQSGIARPPATAVRVEPAPRPFQPPSLPATAGQPTELPELPTVSMPSAPEPNLPLSATAVIPPPPVAAAPAPPQPAVYVPPKPLNLSRPVLPSSIAATVRTKTRVQVKVTIDPKGNVVAAEPVATDTKSRLLAGIVANSARYWRFEPARRDGAPILADLVVNIDYEAGGR